MKTKYTAKLVGIILSVEVLASAIVGIGFSTCSQVRGLKRKFENGPSPTVEPARPEKPLSPIFPDIISDLDKIQIASYEADNYQTDNYHDDATQDPIEELNDIVEEDIMAGEKLFIK